MNLLTFRTASFYKQHWSIFISSEFLVYFHFLCTFISCRFADSQGLIQTSPFRNVRRIERLGRNSGLERMYFEGGKVTGEEGKGEAGISVKKKREYVYGAVTTWYPPSLMTWKLKTS